MSNKSLSIYFFLLISLLSCSTGGDLHHGDLEFEEYEVYVPEGYRLVPLQGIDSYTGKVENDALSFLFDFGWYSSNGPDSSNPEFDVDVRNSSGFTMKIYFAKEGSARQVAGLWIRKNKSQNSLSFTNNELTTANKSEINRVLELVASDYMNQF